MGILAVFNGSFPNSSAWQSAATSSIFLFGWMFWIGVALNHASDYFLSFYIKDNGPRHTAKGMALSDYVKQTLRFLI